MMKNKTDVLKYVFQLKNHLNQNVILHKWIV